MQLLCMVDLVKIRLIESIICHPVVRVMSLYLFLCSTYCWMQHLEISSKEWFLSVSLFCKYVSSCSIAGEKNEGLVNSCRVLDCDSWMVLILTLFVGGCFWLWALPCTWRGCLLCFNSWWLEFCFIYSPEKGWTLPTLCGAHIDWFDFPVENLTQLNICKCHDHTEYRIPRPTESWIWMWQWHSRHFNLEMHSTYEEDKFN